MKLRHYMLKIQNTPTANEFVIEHAKGVIYRTADEIIFTVKA